MIAHDCRGRVEVHVLKNAFAGMTGHLEDAAHSHTDALSQLRAHALHSQIVPPVETSMSADERDAETPSLPLPAEPVPVPVALPPRAASSSTSIVFPAREGLQFPIPAPSPQANESSAAAVAMVCTVCVACNRMVVPWRPMSRGSLQYSLGKYLELQFYSKDMAARDKACSHNPRDHHIRYFAKQSTLVVFRLVLCRNCSLYTDYSGLGIATSAGMSITCDGRNLFVMNL